LASKLIKLQPPEMQSAYLQVIASLLSNSKSLAVRLYALKTISSYIAVCDSDDSIVSKATLAPYIAPFLQSLFNHIGLVNTDTIGIVLESLSITFDVCLNELV